MTTIIPANGGKDTKTGQPIAKTVCVAFDQNTLEILDVTGTHNQASQRATELYHEGTMAVSGEVKYHQPSLMPHELIGMYLHQFQDFIDNNIHPLLEPKLEVITDSDAVTDHFKNATSRSLPDYADRTPEYDHVLDFCILKDAGFVAGAAVEVDVSPERVEVDLGYLHVEPKHRGQGFGDMLIEHAVKQITPQVHNTPKELVIFSDIVSEGGAVLSDKLRDHLSNHFGGFTEVRVVNENLASPTP